MTKRMIAACLALGAAAAGGRGAFAACGEFGGFAIFQCAELAYFEPVPDPNFALVFDPNNPRQIANIDVAYWQIGFGNRNLNSGLGSSGTGNSGLSTFNGNDSGLGTIELSEARTITGHMGVPAGAVCLVNNNFGNFGIDGCCDNDRIAAVSMPPNNDDILNPYYNVYYSRAGEPGIYSLYWQQDYPIAVLLRTSDRNWFAFAAVASLNRGGDGSGNNGPCASSPGTNPAPCDFRAGFYNFRDVVNGLANPVTPGRMNVIPWQQAPDLTVTSDTLVNPSDPNSDHVLDFTWPAASVHSDLTTRPSAHPTLAPQDAAAAPGVGVSDIASRFGLIRYIVEKALDTDPNFSAPTSATETLNASASGVVVAVGQCVRVRTLFGKKPQTATTTTANCRVGRCGDLGYQIAGDRFCPGAGACTPVPEVCDGADNDCDGVPDNGNPGGGVACATGQPGACSAGTTSCQGGALVCTPNQGPSPEICDGMDNNCDGVIDEGNPGGGMSCMTGQPGVCSPGTTSCQGGALVCTPNQGPSPEICDGMDNNCDGVIDEGNPGGGASCNTGQPGVCSVGTTTCQGGALVCAQTTNPSPELCDGMDNDCDGAVDDGNPGGGQSCTTGQPGVCSAGTTSCQGGALVCTQNQNPTPEVCDGLDNDCNGAVDEGNPGGGASCNTGLPGACAAGTLTCQGGSLACVANDPGTPEVCDALDNDCDGIVDDGNPGGGMSCSTGQPGVCSAGTTTCQGGAILCDPVQSPTPEVCDGLDNNCDGVTDEGNPGGGMSCSTGQPGVCSAGTTSCQAGSLVCTQNQNPTPEVCDGLDNNCDGVVDDGNPGGGASCNTGQPGVCSAGTTTCQAGSLVCARNQNPTPEVCDGVDNNCDGVTDEGNPGGGTTCNTGQPGVCSAGTTSCQAGSLVCTQNQNPAPEVCDGLDNDCDGVTDEGNPGGGASCNTGLPGACAAGTTACQGGALTCVANDPGSPEVCDGLDNDCDGMVDDGNPGGGGSCSTGQPGICSAGTVTCQAGTLVCAQDQNASPEVCDGLDNNCDGATDEGNPGGGASCSTGLPGVCAAGTTSCQSGALVCTQNVQPSPEVCDGLDNNCDGVTDEGCGFRILSPQDGAVLDCRPGASPAVVTWDPSTFDRFRLQLASLADFSNAISAGFTRDTMDSLARGPWARACAAADPFLFLRVFGQDRDVARGDPGRTAFTPVVRVTVQR